MGDHQSVLSVAQRNDIPTGQGRDFGVNGPEVRSETTARTQTWRLLYGVAVYF